VKDSSYLIDDFNQAYLHDASQEIMDLYANLNPYRDHTVEEEDNRGRIIRRPLFSHSSLGQPNALNLQEIKMEEFDWQSNTSYIVLMHHHQELAAANLQLIPKNILDYIRKGKCKLILDNTLEGDSVNKFYPVLYNSITNLNIPPSKVYYITNNLIADQIHTQYKDHNPRNTYINVIPFMWNVNDVSRLISQKALPATVVVEEEIQYKRDNRGKIRHFLKVNRTDREQRNLMMLFLNKYNILEKSLISFPNLPNHHHYNFGTLFEDITDQENQDDLKLKTPFDIDNTDRTNHGDPGYEVGNFNADLPFQPIHYKNTFISIVMGAFPETLGACHLHSSTFNPMYCGHPIIQYGPFRALKELKRRGFKTFDKWWDESYDEIYNSDERLRAVMDLVLEISKKSTTEMFIMYESMKEVLEHNIQVIRNYDIKKELKYKVYEQ